ncbi:MAG: pentapeptide repeat-containing protein [Gammaproteobacteria bacterium]|nr:pentapeptide repeat-containing protein [Gammaproteobacteria bacterium]
MRAAVEVMTMARKPELKNDNPQYRLLREGHIKEFNESKCRGERSDLTHSDFRGIDLRGLDADGLDLRGCYFRQGDLRGIDFTNTNLEGASIHATKISGTYFPPELSADEITLSLQHGTRLRYPVRK